jgi:hypothetical protein
MGYAKCLMVPGTKAPPEKGLFPIKIMGELRSFLKRTADRIEHVDHSIEIAAAAKSALAPLGCVRKGRSRTWIDDHGWWVGVIEFQPSGWSKGSYLNVAASYLWKPAPTESSLSFDALVGQRPWRDATEGESFAHKATELASIARESLAELRRHHRSITSTADWLRSQENKEAVWRDYHLGIAFGLSQQVEIAKHHFRLGIDHSSKIEWVAMPGRECRKYESIVENREAFLATVLERIQATRIALKLPAVDLSTSFPLIND